MTNSLFRQSFLLDTLDMQQAVDEQTTTLPSGVQLKLHQRGVLEVIPASYTASSKNMIISTGIHGDETAPMELVDKIVRDIETGFQAVKARCLFIIAHPEATNAHTRFLEENLNRLFDDKDHPMSKELVIADTLKILVKDFFADTDEETRWHLDLHCAIRGFETLFVRHQPENPPSDALQSAGGFCQPQPCRSAAAVQFAIQYL